MLGNTFRWSHGPVNRVVPYRWQATVNVLNTASEHRTGI